MSASLDLVFAALADPTRRAIVAHLAEQDAAVGELTALFPITQPAVSKHLQVLERAGLISRRRAGQSRPCHLEPEGFKDIAAWVESYRAFFEGSLDRLEDYLQSIQGHSVPTPPTDD